MTCSRQLSCLPVGVLHVLCYVCGGNCMVRPLLYILLALTEDFGLSRMLRICLKAVVVQHLSKTFK